VTDPTCPACGVPYHDHLGLHGTCEELQRVKAECGWRDPRPEDHGKYAFIGSLPGDAPPSLLRSYTPLRWTEEILAYAIDVDAPRRWQYWTTAGWVDLTSRVCVCERPSE
jgi:hypothetical protein